MNEQQPIKTSKSSILNIPTNIMGALIFIVPAAFAWIPVIGYFAWIIPIVVFFAEKNSNFVQYCAAESFCIGIIRLVFDVVFNSIRNIALRTVAVYGQSTEFINFWGNVQSPGNAAFIIGTILGIALCVLCLIAAFLAFNKKLLRIPVIDKVSDFMTHELKPQFKHNTYTK